MSYTRYTISSQVYLDVPSNRTSDIAISFKCSGLNVLNFKFVEWMEFYEKIDNIHKMVENRFVNDKHVKNDIQYGVSAVVLNSGKIIRIRHLNEDVEVNICDRLLVILFQLTHREWLELYKKSADVNSLVMENWVEYIHHLRDNPAPRQMPVYTKH